MPATLWNRRLAVLLFALGLLFGMALAGVIAWGDMEASMFDAAISPDAPLTTLRCPVMITTAETTTVSASFTNPGNRPIELFVRAHISDGFATLMREVKTWVPLTPGQEQRVEWPVAPADAAFGRVILVRIHASPSGPLPYRAGSCGIIVLDLPFLTGNLVFAIALAIAVLGMGGGIGLWVASYRPSIRQGLGVVRGMGTLAGAVGVAIIAGLFGMWLVGLVVLLLTVLLIGVMVGYVAVGA
jgi:hypothetical protein